MTNKTNERSKLAFAAGIADLICGWLVLSLMFLALPVLLLIALDPKGAVIVALVSALAALPSVAGIGILLGRNWGRVLGLLLAVILLAGMALCGTFMVPWFVLAAINLVGLIGPHADKMFARAGGNAAGLKNEEGPRRGLSILRGAAPRGPDTRSFFRVQE